MSVDLGDYIDFGDKLYIDKKSIIAQPEDERAEFVWYMVRLMDPTSIITVQEVQEILQRYGN